MKLLLLTCDKTRKIIPAQKWLFNKYIKYPFDYIYIDLKSEDINTWSTNVLNKISHIEDEFIGFGLDDYLPISNFDSEVFNHMMGLMKKDKEIVRYEIGHTTVPHTLIKEKDDFNIKEIPQNADYRMSCQFSIWRKDYLFKMLSYNCTPWEFEQTVSQISKGDGKKMILTDKRWALRWIRQSALSGRHPEKVNVLGIKMNDIKSMVKENLLNEEELQFGMWVGNVLPFTYNFNFSDLNRYVPTNDYNELEKLFKFNYD
jgi:hypothetical protein